MKITVDDYDVIAAYAGTDRSWHDKVSTNEGVQKHITFSEKVVQLFLVSVNSNSKGAK